MKIIINDKREITCMNAKIYLIIFKYIMHILNKIDARIREKLVLNKEEKV